MLIDELKMMREFMANRESEPVEIEMTPAVARHELDMYR